MTDDNLSVYDAQFFEAWETFAEEISIVFEAGESDAKLRPRATAQTRYVLANMAIAKLLKNVGQKKAAEPFHLLAEALQDLVDGVSHPLFKVEAPVGRAGRQPDTSETWRVRSNLCVGIEFLKAGGMDADDAVSLVVKKHRQKLTKLQRPGTDLRSSIKTWLKSFANDEVKNEVALSSYKEGVAPLKELPQRFNGIQIRQVGEGLVATTAERASNLTKI